MFSGQKEEHHVNTKLDTTHSSENILDSFSIKHVDAFTSNDYSFAFLIHLCHQKEHDAEDLFQMIHEFIISAMDKLSYKDIMITKSGVTRCFTNTRFALRELRRFGLIYNEVENKYVTNRIVLPTPIGYLISLYALTKDRNKPVQFLSHHNIMEGYYKPIHFAIRTLRESLDDYLRALKKKYPEVKDLQRVLNDVIEEYYYHLLPNIQFTPTKLIIDENGFHQSMVEYYKKLVNHYELTNKLKAIFLTHYADEAGTST